MATMVTKTARKNLPMEPKIVNTQRCWVVPTKYDLKWTIENISDIETKKIVSPILHGPADTSFQFQLELFQDSIFVKMKCNSSRAPLTVKVETEVKEITVQNGLEEEISVQSEYKTLKVRFKKGQDLRTLLDISPVTKQGSNLLLHCEFIAFSSTTKHQKIARKEDLKDLRETRKFGDSLEDLRKDRQPFLTDTFLLVNGEKFPVHRLVLAARCSEMLKYAERTDINLNNNGKEVVDGLLEYIYTGDPHKLIEDSSRSLPVLKSIAELGLKKFLITVMEYLYEIREFEVFTRCHKCDIVFEWLISNKEIFKLKVNDKITSTNFNFCSTSCSLLIRKENIKDESQSTEAAQKLVVTLGSRNLIKNLVEHIIILDSSKN